MNRPSDSLRTSLRPLVLLLALSLITVAVLPSGAIPAAARHLFQSGVESDSPLPTPIPPTPIPPTPTPLPPTETPLPPTSTPLPPTATVAPPAATEEPPTPTPEPPQPEPTAEPPAQPPEATPPEETTPAPEATVEPTAPPAEPAGPTATEETVHLPAIEGGGDEQPAEAMPAEEAPSTSAEAEQPVAGADVDPALTAESQQTDLASFIDGLAVLLGYGWMACGVLLLLAIPLGLLLFNRWGRRRRQA